MNNRKRLLSFGLLITFALTGVGLYSTQHRSKESELFKTVFDSNSEESVSAVRKLASLRSAESKRMLLEIALSRRAFIDSREAAVESLAGNCDETVSAELAGLLQLHNPLSLRQASATALAKCPCNLRCVQSILSYLERSWRGEKTLEGESQIEEVREAMRKDQELVYSFLMTVLRAQKKKVVQTLVDSYGLSSPVPSKFTLFLVDRATITEACPELELSGRSSSDEALRRDIGALMTKLACPKDLPPLRAPSDLTK